MWLLLMARFIGIIDLILNLLNLAKISLANMCPLNDGQRKKKKILMLP